MDVTAASQVQPDAASRTWGSQEWFSHLFRTQGCSDPAAYYALAGYHLYRHSQVTQFLLQSGLPRERGALLDIGCGTGHLAHSMKQALNFTHAIGTDFVAPLIATAQRNYPNIEFQTGTLPHLEFPSRSFDLVIAAEVLYYLGRGQRDVALSEIHRVLRPGGVLLFTSAIGKRYFTMKSATNLIEPHLKVIMRAYHFNRAFHATLGRLEKVRRLDHVLRTGTEPGTKESRVRLKQWSWVTERRAFRSAVRIVSAASAPLLQSRWPPWIMGEVSRHLIPFWTATNVNLIAAKGVDEI